MKFILLNPSLGFLFFFFRRLNRPMINYYISVIPPLQPTFIVNKAMTMRHTKTGQNFQEYCGYVCTMNLRGFQPLCHKCMSGPNKVLYKFNFSLDFLSPENEVSLIPIHIMYIPSTLGLDLCITCYFCTCFCYSVLPKTSWSLLPLLIAFDAC